jgi:hypothetical protein
MAEGSRRRSAELYSAVSQIFNLQADRIYLDRLASLINLQDTILRYSEICATFRFGPQKGHPRNPGYPWSSSAFGSGFARSGFPPPSTNALQPTHKYGHDVANGLRATGRADEARRPNCRPPKPSGHAKTNTLAPRHGQAPEPQSPPPGARAAAPPSPSLPHSLPRGARGHKRGAQRNRSLALSRPSLKSHPSAIAFS